MIKGLYNSAAGMLPLQYQQNLTANNLANSNTAGYKYDRAFVRELVTADLYLNEHQIASSGEKPATVEVMPPAFRASVGNSSQVVQQVTEFAQGSMEVTGNDFNVAIEGDGFFSVQTPNGIQYTRNGMFHVNGDGNLVTSEGHEVQGNDGPINVDGGKMQIQENGTVLVDGLERGVLQITTFQPPRLTKTSDSLYVPEAGSAGQDSENFIIKQGMLENSNANVIDQLVSMIELNRNFEYGQTVLKNQDQSLKELVTEASRVR